jgi:hypothetical protein
MSVRYQITITDQAEQILSSMVACGIYGRTVPEVIKRLLDRSLVEMVQPTIKKYRQKVQP